MINILQYSTGYYRELADPKRIAITDLSEEVEAEIAIGKNYITGEWVASAYFDEGVLSESR